MKAKIYAKYVECADCGRKIPVNNAHYINGKPYGYSCYKKQLSLIYKKLEDEKNAEYSAKCFAAMQIFKGKKSNSFHDSICKQWDDYEKLTAKQLDCIINGFTKKEKLNFWIIWQELTNDGNLKRSISSWVENKIQNFEEYMENESVINCLLCNPIYKHGFHFVRDIEDLEIIYIMANKKDNIQLKEDIEDEDIEVLKVIEGVA